MLELILIVLFSFSCIYFCTLLLKSWHTHIYVYPCDGKWSVCCVVGAGEAKAAHDADKSHGGSEES